MLSLSLQQLYLLVFINLDYNGDGLICNDDLFTIVTLQENPLISKDVYRIFHHMSQLQQSKPHSPMIDSLADDDPLKIENLTIQKYRMWTIKAEKERKKH